MKDVVFFMSCLAAAFGAAIARIVYFFFPGFNVMDVLVFGALAAGFAYMRPRRWWLWTIILIAPAMLFVGLTLFNLGVDNLGGGIGTGHLFSAVLIPLAAAFGGFVTARRRIAGDEAWNRQCDELDPWKRPTSS